MALCTITGNLKLPSGAVAPYAKLRLVRASLTGTVILKDPEEFTATVAGVVTFTATQGATIYVYCNASGLDTNGPRGVALSVPASSTANLEDLVAVTTDQVGTITASRAAVSNSVGTIVASTTTAAQILGLSTLTAGCIPYLATGGVFAPTSGPGALIDSMGQPTFPNFTVKQTTASTLEDMIIIKNAAGTAVWALDILTTSNISWLDYVNNKNVVTLAAGATYTYLQLLSTGGINFAGTGAVSSTSMGLSRVSTTALAVTGGASIAAGGAYRDLGLRNLLVNGTSSGVVTIAGAAVAGTWTFTLPTTGGTSGYFLQTDGAGTTTWASSTGWATTALDNLASVNINTSLLAQTGVDLGSTTKPFRDLYLFGSGTYGTTYIKQTGTPTSTRTITWPDATGIPAISASALTAGRIPYTAAVNSGVGLIDNANLTWSGTDLTATSTGHANLIIGSPDTFVQSLVFKSAGTTDWYFSSRGTLSGVNHHFSFYNQNAAAEVMTFIQTGAVGINTSTNIGATFQVKALSSTTIGQIIKLAASHSADALQVQNSSSSVLWKITAAGAQTIQSTVNEGLLVTGATSGSGAGITSRILNSTADGYAGFQLDTDQGAVGYVRAHGSGTAGSIGFANQMLVYGVLNGGMSLIASNASGTISFYTGGTATANRWLKIQSTGVVTFTSNDDVGLARNAAGVLEINNGTAGTLRDLTLRSSTYTYSDAVTNALTTLVTYQHNSSGTPAASFGSRVLFNLHSSTTTNQNAGSIDVYWSDATHATRTSVVALCAVNSAAALAEVFKVSGAGLMTPLDGGHFALGTTTGTKFGTSTSQKLAFFGLTPIVQFATTGETTGFTANASTAVRLDSTFTGNVGATAYTLSDVVKALKNFGLMAA